MKQTLLLPLLLTLALGDAALAQMNMPGMDHSSMPMPGPTSSGSGDMGMKELGTLRGKAFERAFLSMMVPHHQAALEMARAVQPLTRDAQVRQWAAAILTDQQREITQMNTLLKGYGGSDARMAARMASGMKGMGLRVKSSRTPDTTFVQDMIPHHASAIEMANLALQKSADAAVLRLARDIVRTQAGELYAFQLWRLKR